MLTRTLFTRTLAEPPEASGRTFLVQLLSGITLPSPLDGLLAEAVAIALDDARAQAPEKN